jgi:cytochrome c
VRAAPRTRSAARRARGARGRVRSSWIDRVRRRRRAARIVKSRASVTDHARWSHRARATAGPWAGVLALALAGACEDTPAERGGELIATYGCVGCHQVPGVVGHQGWLGPSLEGWRARHYIAGRLQNTPEALVRWILDPASISPETAMPDLGVREDEARLMAAYLFSLD